MFIATYTSKVCIWQEQLCNQMSCLEIYNNSNSIKSAVIFWFVKNLKVEIIIQKSIFISLTGTENPTYMKVLKVAGVVPHSCCLLKPSPTKKKNKVASSVVFKEHFLLLLYYSLELI